MFDLGQYPGAVASPSPSDRVVWELHRIESWQEAELFALQCAPVAFQLAYGKYRDEHAIRWKAGKRFVHERVEDGENAGVIKQTPILVQDGPFSASNVVDQFLAMSKEVPRDIVDFVVARLRDHPEYVNRAAGSAPGPST